MDINTGNPTTQRGGRITPGRLFALIAAVVVIAVGTIWWVVNANSGEPVATPSTRTPSPAVTPSPSPSPSSVPGPVVRDLKLDWDTAMYYLANPRTGEVWLDSPQPIADPGRIPSEYWGELAWFKIGEREGRDIIGPLGPFGLSFFEYDGTTLTYIVAPSSFDDPADSTKNHLVESLPTFGVGIDTHTYYDTLSLPAYNPLSAPASNFPWTSFLIDTGHEAQGPDQYRKWVLPSQGSLRFELVDEDLGSRGSVRGENLIARLVRITTPFGLSASITDAKGPAVIGDSPATGHPYVPFFYIEGCAWQWNPHTVIQGSPDADWTPIGSTLSGEEVFAAVPGSTITAIYNRLRTNTETDPEESNAMTTGPDLGTHDGYATIGASSTAPAFLSMPTGAPDEWFVFRADTLFALDGC